MRNAHKQLTVDAIDTARKPWSASLKRVCLFGIMPFFVMDETARSAP